MQETQLQSLGLEDPLEKGFPSMGKPMDREAWQAAVHGVAKGWT